MCESPLKLNQPAAIAKRSLGRLDQVYHAQTGWSTRFRLLVVLDAVDEMKRFGLERFRVVELRRPHVAESIADQHLVHVFRFRRDVDAFVIDLELFARL